MGIFTWLKPKLKNCWSDASKMEASDQRFFQVSYSFTWERSDWWESSDDETEEKEDYES